jgi:hypothetical protein
MHNMLQTAFGGNDLARTQISGWSSDSNTEKLWLKTDNSGRASRRRKGEIMETLSTTIKENKSSSIRRSLICEASRMGHASELKARAQTRGRSPRRLYLRSSPSSSSSSSSSRDFWPLIPWLRSATLLMRPIWP